MKRTDTSHTRSSIFKIVLIEDDEDFSHVIEMVINAMDHYQVKAVYGSCEEAISRIAEDAPDIILMDLDLPGMGGIKGTLKVKQTYPSAEIVILTVHSNGEKVFNALCAGAVGYLTKDSDSDTVLQALEEIRIGGAPMSNEIARMVVQSFSKNRAAPLSAKEAEVLSLLSKGKSYKTIAEMLTISLNTVKYHIKNIYVAMQVNNRESAVELAKQNKWI